MPVLGITGGVATGKSTLSQALLQQFPAEFFDSDQCARVLSESNAFHEQIRAAFGDGVFDEAGHLRRDVLRAQVFSGEEPRKKLEAIFHPAIRAQWLAKAQAARANAQWLLVDIPLLFETGAEAHFDRVIVIACSEARQIRRMISRRGLDVATAQRMIGAQWAVREKVARAHHVIWNDGDLSALTAQSTALAALLRQQFS